MKSIFFLFISIGLLTACNNNKGWTQAERDKLIKSCKDKALGTAGIADTAIARKFELYCTCYQQNLEKKYASVADMGKASPKEITEQAAACIDMMK
jgi:hypothetical protein